MATGRSDHVDFTASNYDGSQTLRVNWSETYNQSANTSDVTVSLQLKTNTWFGLNYHGDLVVKVNGVTAITLTNSPSNNTVYPNASDTFADVMGDNGTFTGTVSGIAHNADGTKSVSISIEANNGTYPLFWAPYPRVFNFSPGSQSITLTPIPRQYTLSISQGTGSTITVKRSGVTLSNGATVTYGDSLVITFAANTGYALGTHTVNGTTFTSGNTHPVTGNVTVVSTATAVKSTISASNSTFGTAQTLTVTRYSSSYTHTVTYSCAGYTGTIVTKSSNTSISWTPPNNIMNGVPNATSASCTLTCTTYSGNTSLGSNSITITLSVPSSVKPSPSLSVSDSMGYATTYGGYVQGHSKMAVTVTDGNQYSATTASRSTTANGGTYTGASFTTGAVKTAGSNTVSTTVRDSRGRTGTASASVTVLAYTAPAITTISVHRCDAQGNADDNGSYFYCDWAVAVTALNNHNSKTLAIRYKRTGGSWTTLATITPSAYTASGTTSPTAISTDYTYTVEYTLTDDFDAITRTTTLSTTPTTLNLRQGGKGVGIGKAAEADNLLDVAFNQRTRGALHVGENAKVRIYEDTEGGNIALDPPDSAQGTVTSWQIDALGGYLRIFAALAGSGYLLPFTLNTDGSVSNLGVVIGDSKRDFRDYGATYGGVTDSFYANAVYTYEGSNRFRVAMSGKLVPENSSTVYTVMPKATLVTAINGLFGKSYTAVANYYGTWRSDPALSLANQGYGRVVVAAGDNTYFGLGRRYDTSGSEGAWAQDKFYNSGSGSMIDIDMVLELS